MDRVLRIVPVPAERGADDEDGEDRIGNDPPGGVSTDRGRRVLDEDADDVSLVSGLRAREPWAAPALVRRYGGHMRRVLLRVLGANDSELGDVLQEVIVNAWEGIGGLSDPRALKSWLTQIAIFTARKAIRRRHRRRWLSFFETVPEPEVSWAGPDLQEAAGCVYRIFEKMPVDERLPFALRVLEGLDLDATAAACGMSVATVRRRLIKAERRFFKLARQFEALVPWLEEAR